jgi:hypothetical protein
LIEEDGLRHKALLLFAITVPQVGGASASADPAHPTHPVCTPISPVAG